MFLLTMIILTLFFALLKCTELNISVSPTIIHLFFSLVKNSKRVLILFYFAYARIPPSATKISLFSPRFFSSTRRRTATGVLLFVSLRLSGFCYTTRVIKSSAVWLFSIVCVCVCVFYVDRNDEKETNERTNTTRSTFLQIRIRALVKASFRSRFSLSTPARACVPTGKPAVNVCKK